MLGTAGASGGGAEGVAVTQLDAHHKMLAEAEHFGDALKKLRPDLNRFADASKGVSGRGRG